MHLQLKRTKGSSRILLAASNLIVPRLLVTEVHRAEPRDRTNVAKATLQNKPVHFEPQATPPGFLNNPPTILPANHDRVPHLYYLDYPSIEFYNNNGIIPPLPFPPIYRRVSHYQTPKDHPLLTPSPTFAGINKLQRSLRSLRQARQRPCRAAVPG